MVVVVVRCGYTMAMAVRRGMVHVRRQWRHDHELLLELGVPVVLDVVVGPPRKVRSDDGPPAPDGGEEVADDHVLLAGEVAVLYVGPQVVEPPQTAALPAPLEACAGKKMNHACIFEIHASKRTYVHIHTSFGWERDPVAAGAMLVDVLLELPVLLR